MTSMNPYINFGGQCREALEFYKEVFRGEISGMQTYGETQPGGAGDWNDKIIHSEFRADGVFFMASDSPKETPPNVGDNISLSLNLTDLQEQERLFQGLSNGGTVTMPLNKTFWGATFGMLTDKYGINWLLNCQPEQETAYQK